jgi:hypothetical protein
MLYGGDNRNLQMDTEDTIKLEEMQAHTIMEESEKSLQDLKIPKPSGVDNKQGEFGKA